MKKLLIFLTSFIATSSIHCSSTNIKQLKTTITNSLNQVIMLEGGSVFGTKIYRLKPSEQIKAMIPSIEQQKGFLLHVIIEKRKTGGDILLYDIHQALKPNKDYTIKKDPKRGFIFTSKDSEPIFLETTRAIAFANYKKTSEEKY